VGEESGAKRQRRNLSKEEKDRICQLLKQGWTYEMIEGETGRGPGNIRNVIKERGGVYRYQEIESGFRLSVEEREAIAVGIAAGWSARRIATGLGRSNSTVTREIQANGGRAGYQPWAAHRGAQERRLRPRPSKLLHCSKLRDVVESGLELEWSPRQISCKLRKDYPDDPEMRVSPENDLPKPVCADQRRFAQGAHRASAYQTGSAAVPPGKPQARIPAEGHGLDLRAPCRG
jgi:IS30 family transposase